MSVWLYDHQWPAVESYLEAKGTILVPIGSTEQHGPHLPLGTDALEAISVTEGVAERMDLLATPPIWYGDARHHLGYPGTVALRPETVLHVLRDVYDSLAHHGFENVITINGHRRANMPAIEIATKRARERHPDVLFAGADLVQIAVSDHMELMEGDVEDGNHGGEFETSFIMAQYPDLVDEDAFEPSLGEPSGRRTTRSTIDHRDTLRVASSWQDQVRQREESDHPGHKGDPTKASVEKGTEIRERMIQSVVEFIEDLDE